MEGQIGMLTILYGASVLLMILVPVLLAAGLRGVSSPPRLLRPSPPAPPGVDAPAGRGHARAGSRRNRIDDLRRRAYRRHRQLPAAPDRRRSRRIRLDAGPADDPSGATRFPRGQSVEQRLPAARTDHRHLRARRFLAHGLG